MKLWVADSDSLTDRGNYSCELTQNHKSVRRAVVIDHVQLKVFPSVVFVRKVSEWNLVVCSTLCTVKPFLSEKLRESDFRVIQGFVFLFFTVYK